MIIIFEFMNSLLKEALNSNSFNPIIQPKKNAIKYLQSVYVLQLIILNPLTLKYFIHAIHLSII